MPYSVTYRFEELPIGAVFVDGSATLNCWRNGAFELGEIIAACVADADGDHLPRLAVNIEDVRTELFLRRRRDLQEAVWDELRGLDAPEVERAFAMSEYRRER